MSNKSDKAKQEELRRQQEQLNAEAAKDRAALREPSAVDREFETESLSWLKFLKDPNRDFSKAPMPFDVSEDGAAGAEEERTALGAMQFGAAGADPNLQAVLKSNVQERRSHRRAHSLESAVARYDAMMRGLGGDVAARDLARRQGAAGITTSAGSNAMNNYAAFQPRPHWGLSLGTAAIGGLSGMFTGRYGN